MRVDTWAGLCSRTVPATSNRGRSAGREAELIGRRDVAKARDLGRDVDVSGWHQRA